MKLDDKGLIILTLSTKKHFSLINNLNFKVIHT